MKNQPVILTKIVNQLVEVRSKNLLPAKIKISLKDLKKLLKHSSKNGLKKHIKETGRLWGLEISLLGKGSAIQIVSRDEEELPGSPDSRRQKRK